MLIGPGGEKFKNKSTPHLNPVSYLITELLKIFSKSLA